MTFAGAIKAGFTNYVNFRGVASRPAFWYWRLFVFLVSLVSGVIDQVLAKRLGFDPNLFLPLEAIAALVFFLPDLSVTARRLRDVGRSGWLLLWQLIPVGLATAATLQIVQENAGIAPTTTPSFSPLAINLILAVLFSTSATSVFFLVLSLSKTKTRAQGNKYAPADGSGIDGASEQPPMAGW